MKSTRLKTGRPRAIIDPRLADRIHWLTTAGGRQVARQLQIAPALQVSEAVVSRLLRPQQGDAAMPEIVIDGARYITRDGLLERLKSYNGGSRE